MSVDGDRARWMESVLQLLLTEPLDVTPSVLRCLAAALSAREALDSEILSAGCTTRWEALSSELDVALFDLEYELEEVGLAERDR